MTRKKQEKGGLKPRPYKTKPGRLQKAGPTYEAIEKLRIEEAGEGAEAGVFFGVVFEGGAVQDFSVLDYGFDFSGVADVFGRISGDDQKRGATAGLQAAPFVFCFHESRGVVG